MLETIKSHTKYYRIVFNSYLVTCICSKCNRQVILIKSEIEKETGKKIALKQYERQFSCRNIFFTKMFFSSIMTKNIIIV